MRPDKIVAVLAGVLAGCIGCLPAAFADDVNPPPYEGLPNSIVLFTSDQGSGLAIDEFNVFPGAFPLSDRDCGNGPGEPCLSITANLGTLLEFQMPNFIDPLPVKEVRIQVTYFGPDPIIASVSGFDPGCPLGVCPGVFLRRVVDTAETRDALYFFEDWQIFPNPDDDVFLITAGPDTQVIQVVIDTFSGSVPVPATLLLLGSGAGGLLGHGWWRRRKHSVAAREQRTIAR